MRRCPEKGFGTGKYDERAKYGKRKHYRTRQGRRSGGTPGNNCARKSGAKRVIAKRVTKVEAMEKVKELCENNDMNFVVRKKDGKFQKK